MSMGRIVGGGTAKNPGNRRMKARIAAAAALALGSGGLLARHAQAGNGTWTNTAGGMWSVGTNWASSNVASGASSIADFSTAAPTAANTLVNLDAPFTVGTLKFNSATTANNFNVSNNGVSTNVLTLNNGASQPVITVGTLLDNFTIGATIAGTNGFIKTGNGSLTLTASNTYSGVTTVNSTTNTNTNGQCADLYLGNNNALGTSTLYIDPGTSNFARVLVDAGVVIPNAITINTSRTSTGGNGTLMANNNGTTVSNSTVSGTGFSGPITINNVASSGGHICGVTDSTLTYFMTFSGPITLSPAYYTANGVTAPNATGKGLLIRSGNVIFSGGGSYFRAELRSGELRDGANNGIATNAYLDMGINANGNPLSFAALDLFGFNQTMVGILDSNDSFNSTAFPVYVTNSSTTPSTLTLTPLPSSNISSGLVFGTSVGTGPYTVNAYLTDNSANGGTLNLVINGDPTGVQTFNTPNSSYHGTTTLTSGILAVNTLANGGSNSAIGAAPNIASNLVFGGGQLRYTGASTSTDHDFTLNTGTTSTINVVNPAATLTMTSGGGQGGTGAGNLVVTGPGTLLFNGINTYTGTTNISSGSSSKLIVDGSTAAGSAVAIGTGGTLGGNGTVNGTVTPGVGGIIAPGDPAINNGIGTLTVGALALKDGSIVNFEMTSGSGNDEVTVANSGGLTVNAANVDLYQPGTTLTFSTNGTYPLFNYTGSIGGSLSNLSIATAAAGKFYSLNATGGVVNLTIGSATTVEWNDNLQTQAWASGGNWIGGTAANAVGTSALFGVNLVGSNGTVTTTAVETVSGLIFNNSSVSYTIGGTGSLNLNNGVAAAAMDVQSGNHTINVPITLSSATSMTAYNPTDSLTVNGSITGAFAVSANGLGNITLTANNSFTSTTINNVTLNVGNGGSTGTLGSGPVTFITNGTLNFNTSANYNFGQSISGPGGVNQLGAGNVSVGAINISVAGTINVSNGSLTATSIAQTGGINVTGSGSMTASGSVSGAGKLTVNTTGSVTLSGSDSYAGGTEVDAGKLTLNNASALPAASVLAVNGGTLDLHGNSITISNELDTTTGGTITNSVASTTSTISLSGLNANYSISAALNDGPSGGKVALVTYIDNTTSTADGVGNEYALTLNSPGNYSGGTTVGKESIQANVSNAFGTGPILFLLNTQSTNNMRLDIVGGVTLPNNITFTLGIPYAGFGDIQYIATTTGSATLNGSVTLLANDTNGGTFFGPTNAGDVLNINGPVYASGTATMISVRGGNVGFAGGGNYPTILNYSNTFINATNGIYPGAIFNFWQGAPVLDLNGNSQTLAGIIINSGTATVTNSNAANGTLTLNTAVADAFAGTITSNLSLIKSGPANLNLSGTLTYTGTTQVSGGSLTFAASPNGGIYALTLPGALNLGAGTMTNLAVPTASANRTLLTIGALNLAGATNAWTAQLDVASNDLDIQSGSILTLSNQLHQGYANGTWNGSNGIVSTVAAADTTHLTALGAIQNNQSGTALYTSFDGASPGLNDLLVKYTYYGDANLDGQVDGSDYSLIDNGNLMHLSGWYNGDFNYDGVVNGSDYTLIDNAFNTQGAQISAQVAAQVGGSSAVPEPATLGILAIGAAGLLGRRGGRGGREGRRRR